MPRSVSGRMVRQDVRDRQAFDDGSIVEDVAACSPTPESQDPSASIRARSKAAIQHATKATRLERMPAANFIEGVHQRSEAVREREAGRALLEPGRIVAAAGEAVPALGHHEITGRRDAMIDTLERPTSIGVVASEQRLELLDNAGVLQAGLDTAQSAGAANSIERMVSHQIAAAHTAARKLLAYLPTSAAALRPIGGPALADVARLGNTAARLMEVSVSASLALQRLKGGGTQRVVVQHQQLTVAQAPTMIVNNPPKHRRGGTRRKGTKK